MDIEQARGYLLSLPHVVETMQWGDNLVFWVGDKAVGGKMFCLITLDGRSPVISYCAGAERYSELLERDGILPAPYLARIYWVAAEGWHVQRNAEWKEQMQAAHAMTLAKLPARVREILQMPEDALAKLIAERRRLLAAKSEARKIAKPAPKKIPAPKKRQSPR